MTKLIMPKIDRKLISKKADLIAKANLKEIYKIVGLTKFT